MDVRRLTAVALDDGPLAASYHDDARPSDVQCALRNLPQLFHVCLAELVEMTLDEDEEPGRRISLLDGGTYSTSKGSLQKKQ